MLHQRAARGLICAFLCVLATSARADIVVGVVLSLSGPAAPVGRAQAPVVDHLPRQVDGEAVAYLVRDDASDPVQARALAIELADAESVDLIIGSTTVASSREVVNAMAGRGVPVITPSALELGRIQPGAAGFWAFRTAPDPWLMANGVVAHLLAHDRRRLAFVAIDGPYGDLWWSAFGTLAETRRLKVESFRRFDAGSATWPWPSAIARESPDAVMVVAAGSAAVAAVQALRDAGFDGPIYQTNSAAVDAFLHACQGRCKDVMMPASPARLAEGDGTGARFRARLGAAATAFGGYIWDAGILLEEALRRSRATRMADAAGTRQALRNGLELIRSLSGVNGVFSMSARDHVGLDQRAVILVTPDENGWKRAD